MYQAELFPVVSHALKKKNVESTVSTQFDARPRSMRLTSEDDIVESHGGHGGSGNSDLIPPEEGFPVIPPKTKTKVIEVPDEENELWYFVHSPREDYGAEGPCGIEELRDYKRIGILKETTLMWQNGLKAWQPLQALPLLKKRLIKLPPIPTRNEGHSENDPIIAPPTRQEVVTCQKLDEIIKFSNSRYCSRCGNTAVGHLPQTGEQVPDLMMLRHSVGSYKNATEVIPGLLWIGNSSTGRSKFYLELGVDLAINCTDTLKGADSKPPHFRCNSVPMVEVRTVKEGESPQKKMNKLLSTDQLITLFDQCHDHIENIRLYPERAKEADLVPPDYRGPVDRYGRPLRSKEEQAIYAAGKKVPDNSVGKAARVLLWSRLGFDRPCALAAAYLIRKWGMSVQAAVDHVSAARIGTIISQPHMDALQEYSLIHTLGDLLCKDCLSVQHVPMVKYTKTTENGTEELMAVRVSDPINATQEDLCQRISATYNTSPCNGKFGVDVCTSVFFHRPMRDPPYTVLINVQFCGRSLSDTEVSECIDIFETSGVLGQIVALDLSKNRFGDVGTTALCSALERLPSNELTVLNLSSNRIGPEGGTALSKLLYPKYSITTLIINNNRLGDAGSYAVANALVIAEKDMFEDDVHIDADAGDNAGMYGSNQQEVTTLPMVMDEEHIIQNCTVTYLDISNNDLGGDAFEAISFTLKSNKSLITLIIDYSVGAKGNDLNHIFNDCRVFNTSLQRISVADTPKISVNTFDNAMRIFQGFSILACASFARCDLTALHLSKSVSKISAARYLTRLDLSGNKLKDQGMSFLVEAIRDSIGTEKLPLAYLDISTCDFTVSAAIQITEVSSRKHSINHLDMSDNDLSGGNKGKLAENISICRLRYLGLNRCQLGTKTVAEIFDKLQIVSSESCAGTLRTLLLSENNIQDSIDDALYNFLRGNTLVQMLDIGFNKITETGLIKAKLALEVKSSESIERKVNELHINIIGNKCSQHALEVPGKARAKFTMRYSHERFDDPSRHISSDAVGDYAKTRRSYATLNEKLGVDSAKYNVVL